MPPEVQVPRIECLVPVLVGRKPIAPFSSRCVEFSVATTRLDCNQESAGSIVTQRAISSSREDSSKPLRDGFLEMTRLPVIENGNLTVGDIQLAIIVNEYIR